MFVIKKEQYEIFSHKALDDYIKRVINHLEQAYPEKVWDKSEDELKIIIQDIIKKAISYSIITEKDVARFIDFTFEFGEGFEDKEENTWIKDILSDQTESGTDKIQNLENEIYSLSDEDVIKGSKTKADVENEFISTV